MLAFSFSSFGSFVTVASGDGERKPHQSTTVNIISIIFELFFGRSIIDSISTSLDQKKNHSMISLDDPQSAQ
jgi:hypothetical protein